jgi:formaldehyde-activating enzyme involved in methanogenesis
VARRARADVSGHDLRRVISRILIHSEEKDITSVYRYSYDAEKRALEFWDRQLTASWRVSR